MKVSSEACMFVSGKCLTSRPMFCSVNVLAMPVLDNKTTGGGNYVAKTNSNRDVMRL